MIGIRAIRLDRGLTSKHVSEKIGIPLRTYVRLEDPDRNFENGINGVPYGHLQKLSAFYGVPIEQLLTSNPSQPPLRTPKRTRGRRRALLRRRLALRLSLNYQSNSI
jgi:transcriptional regulator with XRE-family HTH domain